MASNTYTEINLLSVLNERKMFEYYKPTDDKFE